MLQGDAMTVCYMPLLPVLVPDVVLNDSEGRLINMSD